MNTYVLTKDQFSRAILAGAFELGFIPKTEGAVAVRHAVNGVVLDVVPTTASEAPAPNGKAITTGAKAKAAANGTQVVAPTAPNPKLSPENVKAALVAAGMDSPPGVNTIKGWDEPKLKAAMKWAKNPSSERPAFIVPRKKRSDNGTSVPAPTGSSENLPPLSGAAAHFDQD